MSSVIVGNGATSAKIQAEPESEISNICVADAGSFTAGIFQDSASERSEGGAAGAIHKPAGMGVFVIVTVGGTICVFVAVGAASGTGTQAARITRLRRVAW